MNQQSLQSANDFLRVASATIAPGDFLDRAPTDIGKDAGIPHPLAVARAVRALAARRRLEAVDGRYRLLDAEPLSPGEPESVPRSPRKRKPPSSTWRGKLTPPWIPMKSAKTMSRHCWRRLRNSTRSSAC